MAVEADLSQQYAKETMARSIRKQVGEVKDKSDLFVGSVSKSIVREVFNKSVESNRVIRRMEREAVTLSTKSLMSQGKHDSHNSLVAPLAVNLSQVTHRFVSCIWCRDFPSHCYNCTVDLTVTHSLPASEMLDCVKS